MAASEETKEAVAKAGFYAVWAAIAGPAGILIAALAFGIDRAWNGDAGRDYGREQSREQTADWRQWLAEDRAWRTQQREARAQWVKDGAKPETEPAKPSKAAQAVRAAMRARARWSVGWDDFKRGFAEAKAAAKAEWDRSKSFTKTAKTRPSQAGAPEVKPDQQDPTATPVICACESPRPHGEHMWQDPDDPNNLFRCPGLAASPEPQTQPEKTSPSNNPKPTEEPMSGTNTAPKGAESNVSVLAKWLQRITGSLTKVSTGVDDLSRLADSLASQVKQAREFASATGQATATKTAMDSADAVVAKLKALCIAASQAAAQAQEDVAAAVASTKPVLKAEDSLNAVGATGEAVAPARAA